MKKKLLFLFILFSFFPKLVFASTSSYIVLDLNSGRILTKSNEHQKKLIASTTKIMTCIIALENSNLEDTITVGNEVLEMYGTNIYIKPSEKLTIKDLLYGLMLRSGNDAAITLAVNTLGEEKFIEAMNKKAKEIGMENTTFQNPHGLDENTTNYSTAYDMSILGKYAFQNKTFRKIISTKKYSTKSSLKSYVWYNRMSLLTQYKNCIGGKNGYTPKAGKTLVSYASKNNMNFMIVSLNDSNIYDTHKELYEKLFSQYNNYTIIDKNNFSLESTFTDGKLYIKHSFIYPLTKKETKNITTLIELYPITKDNKAGRIIVRLKNDTIGTVDIYKEKKEKKQQKSFFQKIKEIFY